ncbi:hypothetical protein M153_1548000226, partial [Pseudoloma neurophilia]
MSKPFDELTEKDRNDVKETTSCAVNNEKDVQQNIKHQTHEKQINKKTEKNVDSVFVLEPVPGNTKAVDEEKPSCV